MRGTRISKSVLTFIFMFNFASNSFAQDSSDLTSFNRGSQYYLGDKDQILMNVNVWGYVLKPGQYLVPRHTDLITLISFAGGPREGANLNKIRIIREETTALTNGHDENDSDARNWQSQKIPILMVNVNDHIKKGRRGALPVLRAGDTVIITESGGHKFQKFLGFNSIFGIVATLASVAIIVERLSK